ncbi:MAG: N-acetylneuraminate synthase family protein, partial [Bacteroidetes bacterium]|nr:N-acetylneuraminate synthase family protein [Bacteroidota bacterium]
KIASGELTNLDLIKNAAKIGKPLIVSTGLSTINEISKAVKIIRKKKSCTCNPRSTL